MSAQQLNSVQDRSFVYWNGEQGTEEWHQLRRNRVTATDMAVLFGKSPFVKTLYDLWALKKGLKKQYEHAAIVKGSLLEGKGLTMLKKETGIVFSPAVILLRQHPLMASLDGFDFSERYTAEIKVPNQGQQSDLWRMAMHGIVPDHYMLQIQTGLMISGAEKCFFTVYDGMLSAQIVEVYPEPDMWPEMIERAQRFYDKYIKGDDVPDDKPEILDVADETNLHLAKRIVELDEQARQIKDEMDMLKAQLTGLLENSEATKAKIGEYVEVSKVPQKPRVDWKKVLVEIKPDVDLEKVEEEWREKMARKDGGGRKYSYRVNIVRKKKRKGGK